MIYKRETDRARLKFETIVIGKLVDAGISVWLPEGWKRDWDCYFSKMAEHPWKGPILFYAQYGEHPLDIRVSREEVDIADYSITVTSKHEAWKTVWYIKIFQDGVMRDEGFNFAALIGIGPEEVPC
jgi:hypothetical protein